MTTLSIVLLALLALFLVSSIAFLLKRKRLMDRAQKKLSYVDTHSVTDWDPEFLQQKRKFVDPLADDTIRQIMAHNEKAQVNHLFEGIVLDREKLPKDAPKELIDFFEKTAILPAWADPDLIALGQQVHLRHGLWVSLLLSYKSLPECYACAQGAEVLHRTARLNEQHGSLKTFSRRVGETAQFVLYAMSPDGLTGDGDGIKAAQKVRLIHAVIRFYLNNQNWDSDKYGEPINQEDMTGTLMSFSALILEGMETIGVVLEPAQREAYIHCWRIIGHIMGVQDDMIPKNATDALKLGHSILDRQIAPSQQGTELTHALLDFQNVQSKPFLGPESNLSLIRFMMGGSIADTLGVPPIGNDKIEKIERKLKRIVRIGEILDNSLIFAMPLQFLTKTISILMVRKMTKAKIINFYLPKSLTLDWGLPNAKS